MTEKMILTQNKLIRPCRKLESSPYRTKTIIRVKSLQGDPHNVGNGIQLMDSLGPTDVFSDDIYDEIENSRSNSQSRKSVSFLECSPLSGKEDVDDDSEFFKYRYPNSIRKSQSCRRDVEIVPLNSLKANTSSGDDERVKKENKRNIKMREVKEETISYTSDGSMLFSTNEVEFDFSIYSPQLL